MNAEIPANTTATIYIPATNGDGIMESGRPVGSSAGVQVVGFEKEYFVVKVGSGKYEFTSDYK